MSAFTEGAVIDYRDPVCTTHANPVIVPLSFKLRIIIFTHRSLSLLRLWSYLLEPCFLCAFNFCLNKCMLVIGTVLCEEVSDWTNHALTGAG